MGDRQQRIRADWSAVEERGKDLEALGEILDLGRVDLQAQIEPLQLAVEGGCVEYKRSVAIGAFRELDGARFRSLSNAAIADLARQFSILVYIATAQRMMCDGTLVVRERRSEPRQDPIEEETQRDIKEIIAGIQKRIGVEPEFKARPPVKNILMQLSRYTRELDALKEATERTPKEKRRPMVANFQRVTEEIYASIRRNYEQLEADELAEIPTTPQHILLRFDLKPLVPVCMRQARLASGIRSSLVYIREEQFGIRELLSESAGQADQFQKQLSEEEQKYLEIGGTETIGHRIALGFRSEIEKRIAREIDYY